MSNTCVTSASAFQDSSPVAEKGTTDAVNDVAQETTVGMQLQIPHVDAFAG